jgi:alpha-galactosidase
MVRWLEITNTGKKSTAITRVSPWSGMLWNTPDYAERIDKESDVVFEAAFCQYEDWGHEGGWKFEPILNGSKIVSGTRGKSGWGHPTFFARNRATGEWFVGSLAWSGNWTIRLTSQQDLIKKQARLFFEMGPDAADPTLRVLSPGETVKSPETHLFCMQAELDQVVQTLHNHVRRDVLPPAPPGREHQVEANHRGYIVDHEDEAGMKREIDLATEVGAELFMIDAGWYGPEPNRWAQNVGDWYAGSWLPNDLMPIREYARQKGLLFGLWVEIESIGSASRLRKEHPDWVATRDGQPIGGNPGPEGSRGYGRQLDLANPKVAAWMESEILRLIAKYALDMFRIDYNTTINEGGNRVKDGFVENTLWRYTETLYGIFDRVHQKYPNVILQNCAGGGGRLDLGILQRFHNTELTDWMRGPRSVKILNGMTWILPPEILLRTFGTEVGDHSTDGDLDWQLRVAMMSRPIFRGISPSVAELNPLARTKIRNAVELYKRVVRPIMVGSRVYHFTPVTPLLEPTPWVVLEYATQDGERAVASFFRTALVGESTFRFVPRGLNFARTYHVTFCNSNQVVEFPGYLLLTEGIPIRLQNSLNSEMLIFERTR